MEKVGRRAAEDLAKLLGEGWLPYVSSRGPAVFRETKDKSSAWFITQLSTDYLAEYVGSNERGKITSLSSKAYGDTPRAAIDACLQLVKLRFTEAVTALTKEAENAEGMVQ